MKTKYKGLLFSFIIGLISYFLGKQFPIIGGAIFGLVFGLVLHYVIKDTKQLDDGIKFTSKKVLQYGVILLGFGLNLNVIFKTGITSLPIIISTIATALIIGYVISKILHIDTKIATLISVGSSICGGSAIAASSPCINASDQDVAESISTIFFFNVLAAILFPILGNLLHFSTTDPNAFGIFAGTAINDTSSVTAASSTWDALHHLGTATLDIAVTVKLTRTLAIIPITIVLSMMNRQKGQKLSKTFPTFIIYFLVASLITTVATHFNISTQYFTIFKNLSHLCIYMAMFAIGMGTDIKDLILKGGKSLILGASCWFAITCVSLLLQHFLHLW